MPAFQIEYDVVTAGPGIEMIRKVLAERGRRGYALNHTHVDAQGVYTFILSKDTGMHVEDDHQGEWVDDGFVNEETAWT
jgi:hypothetical protein